MKYTKKLHYQLILALLILASVFSFSSCKNGQSSNITSISNPLVNESQNACQHQWTEANCIYPKTCRLCQQTEGTANGHAFSEATCTEPKTCKNCMKTEGEKLGHLWESATCQKPKSCSRCDITEGSSLNEHTYQNGKCVICNKNDPKETEFKSASIAYLHLTMANEMCERIMSSIYGGWYFAIYKSDDYLYLDSCLKAFCIQTDLEYNDVLTALNDVLENMGYSNPAETQQVAALRTFSIAVDVVVQTYINYDTYDSIDRNLSIAKDALKSVTDHYADYTGYNTLKSYYSEILSYAEFASAPSGSFSQLQTLVDTYETNLRRYKNDLSFIFD